MSGFTIEVQHTPETISAMSYVQYSATHGRKKAVQVLTAAVCLLLGTHLIGDIRAPFHYLFSAYGCFALLFLNLPAKWRAEKIVKGIQASGRGFPCSIFRFEEEGFRVTAKGFDGPGEFYAYSGCHRLVEHRSGRYYFIGPEAAFLFPPQSLSGGQAAVLKAFLEAHTGLRFTRLQQGLNASLRSLLHTRRNTRSAA